MRRRRRRGRPAGPTAATTRRTWELLSLLRVGAGADTEAIRADLGGLSRQQLKRAMARARRILRAVGGDIVVERVKIDIHANGLPRLSYRYRSTLSITEAFRMLTSPD